MKLSFSRLLRYIFEKLMLNKPRKALISGKLFAIFRSWNLKEPLWNLDLPWLQTRHSFLGKCSTSLRGLLEATRIEKKKKPSAWRDSNPLPPTSWSIKNWWILTSQKALREISRWPLLAVSGTKSEAQLREWSLLAYRWSNIRISPPLPTCCFAV